MFMRIVGAALAAFAALPALAEEGRKPAREPKRPLALVALIDNHNADPMKGALADFVGRGTTSMANLRGHYKRTKWLSGQDATYVNFFEAIKKAAEDGYVIDVFIECHGSPEELVVQGGRNIRGKDIQRELYLQGGERIRLVYMMACYGSTLNDDWLAVGAKGITGHLEVNSIPVFHLPVFLRHWVNGDDAKTATAAGYKFGASVGKSNLYKTLSKWFQGHQITDKEVVEESRVVYAGENVRISEIPTQAEEDEWVAERIVAELDGAEK